METHFVSVRTTFPSRDSIGPNLILLRRSLFGDHSRVSAPSHGYFLQFVPSVLGNSMTNVMYLISDIYNGNKAVSNLIDKPLIEFYSHRFNLAVQESLQDYTEKFDSVYELMVTLQNLFPVAKL